MLLSSSAMVKKGDCGGDDVILYISIGLIITSTVFLVISVSLCCTVIRRRRRNYCNNCKQIIRIENVIKKDGLSAVSQDSLVRVKRAISSSLTDNPEYDSVPAQPGDYYTTNPHYIPLPSTFRDYRAGTESYRELARSKDSVIRIEYGGSSMRSCKSNINSRHQEYEYMRSPRLNRKLASYVNTKNSSVSINSSKSVI